MAKVLHLVGTAKKVPLIFALFVAASVFSTAVSAQTVRGKVVDSRTGEPLVGVSVAVKGNVAQTGVATGINGEFVLNAGALPAVIEVSYIGYKSQEIDVYEISEPVIIYLVEDFNLLNEIVVVGYGTQKKKDLTGSVANISGLRVGSVPAVSESLQGKLSGVRIQQTGGDLTGRYQFSVRGTGSVTGNNDPLVVIDGVPLFDNNLSMLNPKDVVSVDVLKDASASAIYGSRASNGVVIITTGRGRSGRPVVTFSTEIGVENIARRYKVLTTEQQRQLFVQAFKNTNRNPAAFENVNDPVWKIDTNWQDLGTQTGARQNYSLNISGGSEYNKYMISSSYLKRIGTMRKTGVDEFYLRANNDVIAGERLKITSNISGTYQRQDKVSGNDTWGGGYQRLVSAHSYVLPYDENGNLFNPATASDPYFGENTNPLINLFKNVNNETALRVLGNIKADLKLSKHITFAVNAGADLGYTNGYQYLPVYAIGLSRRDEGQASNSSQQTLNWVTDATLQYEKVWAQHVVNVLGGVSAQQFAIKDVNATGTGTVDNSLDQLSNQTNFSATGASVTASLLSTFLRLNYGFNDKYLLTGTIRRDGSSKFGADRRYGLFPSISGAWRVSNETFFKRFESFIKDLKLRIGYGITGNQNIGDFAFVTRAGASPYVWGNGVVVGNSPVNMGNSKLQWESANQFNIGFDAVLFNGRLSVIVDYYNKKSENLLIQTPVPYIAAVTENPFVNLGSLQNRGIETGFTSQNLTGKINWTTNFNITFNKNKVLNIGKNALGDPLQIPGMTISLPNDFANLTQEGHPVGAFYMYRFAGIWQNSEREMAALSGAVPGDPKFVDRNNNNILDDGDKEYVGSPLPVYFGGLNNTLSYGQFTIDILFNFSGGNKLYNGIRNLNARAVPFNQQLAEVADFWTDENPSNKVPRPSQGGNTTFLATRISTNFLEDAAFLKLKNISLSYNLPGKFLSDVKISSASITFNATNLLTFTKYSGLDPEALSTQSLLSGGIDLTPYPPTRYYSLSLQVSF